MKSFPIPRDKPPFPPREVADLRRNQPVTKVRLWNGSWAWMLTRYEHIKAAFLDPALSSDISLPGFPAATASAAVGRSIRPNFVQMDDPRHRRIRNLFLADFMPRAIDLRRHRLQEIVDEQLARLHGAQGPVDLVGEFARPIPIRVVSEILGMDLSESSDVLPSIMVMLESDATAQESTAANGVLIAFLTEKIEARRRQPGDDLISRAAARLDEGGVDVDELVGSLKQILAAGADSTASNMSMGIWLLLTHPEQLATLRERNDRGLWDAAVDEIVRFASVTHLGRRRVATKDLVIGGQLIRAGEGVILNEAFANHDESMFESPEVFDVARANANQHLGFGHGTHHCLGSHLARAELSMSLSSLFSRFPDLRMAIEAADVRFRDDLTLYGLESLQVLLR